MELLKVLGHGEIMLRQVNCSFVDCVVLLTTHVPVNKKGCQAGLIYFLGEEKSRFPNYNTVGFVSEKYGISE